MTMTSNLGRRVFTHGLVLTTTALTCIALRAEHEHSGSAEKFINKALAGGKMEVQMGQLAQRKGEAQEVKSLGETLVRDHTAANQQLEQLATKNNITVHHGDTTVGSTSNSSDASRTDQAKADRPGKEHAKEHARGEDSAKHAKHQQAMNKLQNASGAEFDKAFVRMAIKDHKKDIAEFEKCRTDLKDADLTAFIDQTLPKLRQHLQMAQSAAKAVGVDEATVAADRDDDDNDSAVGAPAAGATGTRGSDKPSSPASKPDKDRSSLDRSDRLNGATDADLSGTIRNNTPSADVEASVGDRSVSASTDIDRSDRTYSSDTDSRKGKVFQKGDGKVLGLSTDKNDGKFLGIIPDPKKKDSDRKHDANIKADVDVNGHDASVGASATTETGSSSRSESKDSK